MQNLYEEVGSLDRRCCERYALSEALLMEHAAEAMASEIRRRFAAGSRVAVVCGAGNNGADGMALARLLQGAYEVTMAVPFGAKSPMAVLQLECSGRIGLEASPLPERCDVLVDALFGSGLSRPLEEEALTLLRRMNALGAFKIACDMPSGLRADGTVDVLSFKAELTVTMGALKRGMFSDAAKERVGEIVVADLGVGRSLYETESAWKLLDRGDLCLPYRTAADVHKGSFGHLGVVCGEKQGAAVIAGSAALRFGAGLVTLLCNEPVNAPYELMQSHLLPSTVNAVALGMGLGQEFSEVELQAFLRTEQPLLLDADIFAHPLLPELLKRDQIVLTPHPREFTTLLHRTGIASIGTAELQRERFRYAEAFCRAYPNTVLLLKGANVIIGQGERFFVNPHGSSVLAKGGSGDVLGGLVGALLAQGYTPLNAALHASLAHTEAAGSFEGSSYALTPNDLIEGVCRL